MSMTLAGALAQVDAEMAQGRFAQAHALLRQIDSQVPGQVEVGRRIAFCAARLGQFEPALRILSATAKTGDAASAVLLDMVSLAAKLPAEARQAQLDVEMLRHSVFMDFPKTLTIETFAKCNAACTFCPYPTLDRQGTLMPDDLFDKILADLAAIPAEIPFSIAPFKVNEPFLDKRMFDLCRRINERLPNASIQIFSNGSTLTTANLKKLAEIQRLEFLWISLNHHDKAAYEALMGLRFDQTLARMQDVWRAKDEGWLKPPVKVSRVADGSADDAAFEAFVTSRFPGFQPMLVGREDWVGQVEVTRHRSPKPQGCTRWYELSIMATGEVALCCMDGKGEHVVGDVRTQSVLEIYNSPAYRALRETARTRLAAPDPCRDCTL
jgi:hypothetical protein